MARRAVASASTIVSARRESSVHVTPRRLRADPMDRTGQRMSNPAATRACPARMASSQPGRIGADGRNDHSGSMLQPVT